MLKKVKQEREYKNMPQVRTMGSTSLKSNEHDICVRYKYFDDIGAFIITVRKDNKLIDGTTLSYNIGKQKTFPKFRIFKGNIDSYLKKIMNQAESLYIKNEGL